MSELSAFSLYEALSRAVFLDEFPEDTVVAAIFGMSNEDRSVILGVWKCIFNNGLAPRQELLAAIREHCVKEFFHQQNDRLLPLRVPYSWRLLSARYDFDNGYQLVADPPLDILKELRYAENEALDAYAIPRFQTPETQKKLWDRVDELALMLLGMPASREATEKLKNLAEVYEEAKEMYGATREPPAAVVACWKEK